MGIRVKICGWAVLMVAAAAAAEDRLPVLEFFGNPNGELCIAAGPAMMTLQEEMEGSAVLLEYNYFLFPSDGRVGRWWHACGCSSATMPMVMVGSGQSITSNWSDFESVYRQMILTEAARPPEAEIEAFWRRIGDSLRLYVRATNTSGMVLSPGNQAALWALVWEERHVGVSDTWVVATVSQDLPASLSPGEEMTVTLDTPSLSDVYWTRVRSLVLLEHRPAIDRPYDQLQAALTQPTELAVEPMELALSTENPSAELSLSGPYVLQWDATVDVPWLAVTPASGSVPGSLTVDLQSQQLTGSEPPGQVRIEARGDGLILIVDVTVSVEVLRPTPRRASGRVSPAN
jgi:hypothetical protein